VNVKDRDLFKNAVPQRPVARRATGGSGTSSYMVHIRSSSYTHQLKAAADIYYCISYMVHIYAAAERDYIILFFKQPAAAERDNYFFCKKQMAAIRIETVILFFQWLR